MKKQIAVLMAAATAVTTVAPVLAHADVTSQNTSLNGMVEAATKALGTKYKDRLSNGIDAEPMGALDSSDSYLDSRYIVLLTGVNGLDNSDFPVYEKSAYAKYKNYSFEIEDGKYARMEGENLKVGTAAQITGKSVNGGDVKNNTYYVVKNASKLRNLLEENLSNTGLKLIIVDKGATKDGASYNLYTEKAYVPELMNSANAPIYANDTQVSLNDTATMLLNLAQKGIDDENPTFVSGLKITVNGVEEEYVQGKKIVKAADGTDTKTYKNEQFADAVNNQLVDTVFDGDQYVTKIKLKLSSGVEKVLESNNLALDFQNGIKADKGEIKLFNKDIDNNWAPAEFINLRNELKGENTQAVLDQITDFAHYKNVDNQSVKVDVNNGDTDIYSLEDVQVESIALKDIFTREGGYTQDGADFVNAIVNSKVLTNVGNDKTGYQFNYGGHNYFLAGTNKQPLGRPLAGHAALTVQEKKGAVDGAIRLADATIDTTTGGYKLTLDVRVVEGTDIPVYKVLRFEITGATQKDLYDILRDLNGKQNVVAGHFVKLAGKDRYETAIAVSQEGFAPATAKSVVIVGGQAQLDGLSAAPLASAKYAPILLADPKTGLSDATIREIARACVYNGYTQENNQYNNVKNLKNKVVYIVGGENSVPTIVEKQLKDKFGVTVVRVAGRDRVATSLDVAKRLTYDGNTNGRIFFVGAEGAADAMSVSAVAAQRYTQRVDANGGAAIDYITSNVNEANDKVSPILVVPQAGLNRDIRNFLVQDTSNVQEANKINNLGQVFKYGYLIGGENSISTQVLKDVNLALKLKGVADITAKRISGSDRYATNVDVINTFYVNGIKAREAKKLQDRMAKYNELVNIGNTRFTKIVTNGAVFASGKNQYLVDAQTSGAFASYHNMPIVLTDNGLTSDQVDLMDVNGVLHNQRAYIYQVGGVVSPEAMKIVVDKLGL